MTITRRGLILGTILAPFARLFGKPSAGLVASRSTEHLMDAAPYLVGVDVARGRDSWAWMYGTFRVQAGERLLAGDRLEIGANGRVIRTTRATATWVAKSDAAVNEMVHVVVDLGTE